MATLTTGEQPDFYDKRGVDLNNAKVDLDRALFNWKDAGGDTGDVTNAIERLIEAKAAAAPRTLPVPGRDPL